jgi:twinkle protein
MGVLIPFLDFFFCPGPTGSGKTTFLSQLSLDLAEQHVNVLWGSFEIQNRRLIAKLLQQFARNPLPRGDPTQRTKLDVIADRFEELPLYFLKFHGGSDIHAVLDAMEHAVYVYDVGHIILDNMQFMISREAAGAAKNASSFSKFDVQDMAVERFRKFATEHNVHVTLVVHPRKEEEDTKLNISSIYGSAKATQEADTVLILQKDHNRKYIEVKKNRFDGTLGHVPLHFDGKSGRYSCEPLVNGKSIGGPSDSERPRASGGRGSHNNTDQSSGNNLIGNQVSSVSRY